ncbi:MAG: alpha-hydroxy acid oxidase, partial [Pseudomonadota bacterium]
KPTASTLLNLATKLPWCMEMLGTPRRTFRNVVGHAEGVKNPQSLTDWTGQAFDKSLNWDRVAELRRMWDGKVILKGILDVEDAKKAVNVGADGIVVSNHGGRQLDGALSSIRSLEPIVEAVGDKTDVMLDSGIRSGQDILKALALGAKGVMIGRAMVYGLGAMGQKGVTAALTVLQKELDNTMALAGRTSIDAIDRSILRVPRGFAGDWDSQG